MAFFLLQVAYAPEATAALLKNPQDRKAALAAQGFSLAGARSIALSAPPAGSSAHSQNSSRRHRLVRLD